MKDIEKLDFFEHLIPDLKFYNERFVEVYILIFFLYRLHAIYHSVDESTGLFACPKRATGKFEFIDCGIVDFHGIARFKRCTIISLFDARRISEVF
jgi:hypothetical protein